MRTFAPLWALFWILSLNASAFGDPWKETLNCCGESDKEHLIRMTRVDALRTLEKYGAFARESVPKLIPILNERDSRIRVSAMRVFAAIGPDAKLAIPALMRIMKEERGRREANEAILAIAKIDSRSQGFREELLKTLAEDDGVDVKGAIIAARRTGIDSKILLPLLKKHIKDKWFTESVLETLSELDSSQDEIKEILVKYAQKGSPSAIKGLCKRGQSALPLLLPLLKAESPKTRETVIRALGDMGREAQGELANLVQCLKDPKASPRQAALEALVKIRPGKSQVADIIEVLKNDPVERVRISAAEALGEIGPLSKEVIPALIWTLKRYEEEGEWVIEAAAKAIALIGKEAVAPILCEFKGKVTKRHIGLVQALAEFGPKAKGAVGILTRCLSHDHMLIHEMAGLALCEYPSLPKATIEQVFKNLKDKRWWVRSRAYDILARADQENPKGLDTLLKNFTKDCKERSYLIETLSFYGEKALPALEKLLRFYGTKNASLASAVIEATASIGKKAIPSLKRLLKEGNPKTTQHALRTLGRIGPAAWECGPLMMDFLKDNSFPCRSTVAFALGSIGPKIIPCLAKEIDNKDFGVRGMLAVALSEIEQKTEEAIPLLVKLAANK